MEIFVYDPRERATVHLSIFLCVILFSCVIFWLVLVGGRLYALAHGMRSVGLVVVRVVSPAKKG